ncbi:SUMF1/EgtB/PvdO family nonheme iron enzyme [Nocardia salmonicida]|uniref:SUMF1/EgtB/PvdO family nonheme iron enzyme n=1 Tax=Nocardia salmonicida TaxID=53431 RepID=UPI0007A415C0|nr:SUMF1/EgtB/PvdO family nonheme iron enzyme [Nocardia salmonicida]MBC7299796.1 SUMF1/EgtB/PvdO family nonheme iron enzyme [Nocardia sp.]
MVATVRRWSGTEVKALREARRLSVRDFAAHLGVSDRMVSKWEAGRSKIFPRPINQAALDTSLARLTSDERARFIAFVGEDNIVDTRETDVPEQSTVVRHPGDGKLMAWIPEGVFLSGTGDLPVYIDGFYLDVYPTTNADYHRFVSATGHSAPRHWESASPPPEIATHPVVWVSWHDATAYADWARKQLPTNEQWEKAARGSLGNIYPWGSQPTPAKCNVRGSGPGTTTPVDNYRSGASPYGIYDMCGGVWEWTSTATVGAVKDRRGLKGGAFTSLFESAVPSACNDARTGMTDDDTGFRCATATLAI